LNTVLIMKCFALKCCQKIHSLISYGYRYLLALLKVHLISSYCLSVACDPHTVPVPINLLREIQVGITKCGVEDPNLPIFAG
jgi:hypothetical protein